MMKPEVVTRFEEIGSGTFPMADPPRTTLQDTDELASGLRCVDRLADILEAEGVDTIFGVPGGAISPMYDALVDHPKVRVVHVRHETSALFMAIGYHRLAPRSLPCTLVTSGPGVTNVLTGVAVAHSEGVPALVLGGEVPRSQFGRRALQEGSSDAVDTVGMMRTVTRHAACATHASHAPFQLSQAMRIARVERGPVFLSIPLDVATAEVPPATFLRPVVTPKSPDEEAIAAAVEALAGAARPLLLLGAGARGASASIRAFAEQTGIPVMTSPRAKGIVPESAPYCLGVFGHGGHPSTSAWLATPPDVVLALGCGLSESSTNSWSKALQASHVMIQVDLDPSQLARNYRVDLAIEADCAEVVDALTPRLRGRSLGTGRYELTRIEPPMLPPEFPLRTDGVLRALQSEMPKDTVYTADIGEHMLFAVHYLEIEFPDQFIASLGFGSMGSGIGAAIGAKLAAPERPVVAICGDFGFQMYGAELNTCVQEGIAVVFVIINDARMRMVEAGIDRIYQRGMSMAGPPIDFAALARSHGARGFVVETPDDLRLALGQTAIDGPTVIDVHVDPGVSFPINARVSEIRNAAVRQGGAR